jgi:hypothetical protein
MSTNSQPAVGIAGVQAAARSNGSATRAGSKKFFLLAIKWAPLIGLLLALAFLWKDYASKTPSQKGDTPIATTSTQAVKQAVKWERLADGSIPIGVWSETLAVVPGCTIRFDAGNGTVYRVQYRLYKSEWVDHIPKTVPDGDEVRFSMIKSGVQNVPVRNVCS